MRDVSRTEQSAEEEPRETEECHADEPIRLKQVVVASPEQPAVDVPSPIPVPEPHNDDGEDGASFDRQKQVEPAPSDRTSPHNTIIPARPPTNPTERQDTTTPAAAAMLDRATLESNKSDEIKKILRDRSFTRTEKKRSLEEIKKRYNLLLEQCEEVDPIGGGAVGSEHKFQVGGDGDDNDEDRRMARRKAELAAVMKDRSLDKQTRLTKLAEIKKRYPVDGDVQRRRTTVESSGTRKSRVDENHYHRNPKGVPVEIVAVDRGNDSGGDEEEERHRRGGGKKKKKRSSRRETGRHHGSRRSNERGPKERRVEVEEEVSSGEHDEVHKHRQAEHVFRQESVEAEEVSSDEDEGYDHRQIKRGSRQERVEREAVSSDDDEAYNRHAARGSRPERVEMEEVSSDEGYNHRHGSHNLRREQAQAEEESSDDGGSRSNSQVQDERLSSGRGSDSDDDDNSSIVGDASKDVVDDNMSYRISLRGNSPDDKSSQSSGSYRSSQQDAVSSEEGDRIGELSSSRRSTLDDDISAEEPSSKPSGNMAGYVPKSRKLNRKDSGGSSSSNKKSVTISEPSSTSTSARSLGVNPLESAEVNKTPIKTLIRKLDKNDPSLTVLKLDGRGKIKEGDWESFFNVLESNTTLTHLSLGRCGMTDDLIVGLILALVDNSTLITLHLMSNKDVTEGEFCGLLWILIVTE